MDQADGGEWAYKYFTGHTGHNRFGVDEKAGHKVRHAHVPCVLSADILSHGTTDMIVVDLACILFWPS